MLFAMMSKPHPPQKPHMIVVHLTQVAANCTCRPLVDFKSEMVDALNTKIPAGRFGKPEEVADAVSFLINNQYANNCILNLDGGMSAI